MNLSASKMQLHPQHTNRCYCRNGNFCCCHVTGHKKSINNLNSSHKFIKVNSDKNKMKSSLLCSSSACSDFASSAPRLISSISTRSILHEVSSSEPRLTARRKLYEQSQGSLNQIIDVRALGMRPQQPTQPDLFCDDKIAKLQEFRLRNSDECLSTCSRYSIDNQYRMKDLSAVDNVPNGKYMLNKRGLLESVDSQDSHKKVEHTASVAIVDDTKSAAKDILRQKLKTTKEKEKFLRKALCVPDNSLALRYQKTF